MQIRLVLKSKTTGSSSVLNLIDDLHTLFLGPKHWFKNAYRCKLSGRFLRLSINTRYLPITLRDSSIPSLEVLLVGSDNSGMNVSLHVLDLAPDRRYKISRKGLLNTFTCKFSASTIICQTDSYGLDDRYDSVVRRFVQEIVRAE